MGYKKSLTPGAIEVEQGSLSQTREDVRLDQIIPSEILENKDKLDKFLQSYYTFMNMDEFIFQETNVFEVIVLDGLAQFRIADPNNENNKFFTDESGASSTLILKSPTGTEVSITLTDVNVAITNGNELPGSLATSISEIGKTFTVNGLAAYNNYTAKLTTIQKNWVGPGPSYVMNTIEQALDIDTNSSGYLELMQKEIAATIPRGVTVDKRTLYKQIIDFYRLRGSTDSIEIFFKILFNDFAEIEFPYDKVLIPSSGNWDVNPALTKGGQYLDNKGFLSDSIKIQDSLKFQKFSYLIKTGKNLSDWELSYDRLVHPSGFIYFAEILIFLQLTRAVLGEDFFHPTTYVDRFGRIRTDGLGLAERIVLSAAPLRQPGIIGPEDIPVLIEMFVSTFLPTPTVKIHKSGTLSLALKNGVINTISMTSGGSGYTSVPSVASTDSASASGFTAAELTPVLSNGSVASVTIVNGGRDYGTPIITFPAPTAIVFNGSDDEVLGTGIVNLSDNTIKLTSAQQSALPVNSVVTYSTTGTAIAGLVSGTQYKIHTSSGNKVKLKAMSGSSIIDITGVGVGTTHKFTGTTATATATSLNGALKSLEVNEPGYGYTPAGGTLTVNFNGTSISGLTGVNPSVTIGIDAEGKLNKEAITIASAGEGSNWAQLFGSVAANPNVGKIAEVRLVGLADKNYTSAPTLTFPAPTSKDAAGNLLSTNVTATAVIPLDGDGEISTNILTLANGGITNVGNGYINDPEVKMGSGLNNEIRVADHLQIQEINCNHNVVTDLISEIKTNPVQAAGSQDGATLFNGERLEIGSLSSGDWTLSQSSSNPTKFLQSHTVKVVDPNFRTIINNNYKQRKGTDNFYNTPRLYNTNQTIEFLGSKTLQTISSSDINNNNTRTFVHIE